MCIKLHNNVFLLMFVQKICIKVHYDALGGAVSCNKLKFIG
jgi:hypothetical protein